MVIIRVMSDEKPKPVDDLREGLGLLFRAAKGAVERLPTGKIEDVAKDAVREVGRAFESLGSELEKVVGKAAGYPAPPPDEASPATAAADAPTSRPAEPATEATVDAAPKHDDAAPEPPKGPRIAD